MKSARLESSSSPTGESSDSGSREMRRISRTRSAVSPVFSASSSMVGSRSSSWSIWRWMRMHPVHALDHVHRDADGAGLVGDRAGDGLADPPRGVRRELEALGVVELLDRPHQAEVALLDQVEEQHAAPDVALGDATPRGAGWPGSARPLASSPSRTAPARMRRSSSAQSAVARPRRSLGLDAGLDAPGQVALVVGGEQVDPADLLEVHAHRVGRAASSPTAAWWCGRAPAAPAAAAPSSSSASSGRWRPRRSMATATVGRRVVERLVDASRRRRCPRARSVPRTTVEDLAR